MTNVEHLWRRRGALSRRLLVMVSALAAGAVALASTAAYAQLATGDAPLRLDFGPGAVADGYTQVGATAYSAELGYGFVDPARVTEADRGTGDAVRGDFVQVDGTAFVVDLPAGDYSVSLIAGDATEATDIAITVESIAKVQPTQRPAGQYLEMTFEIALVDGQLTFDVTGSAAKINSLVITALPERAAGEEPTGYIAGDSTVQTYDPFWEPQAGWGQMIDRFFDDGVQFDNHAIGGRSSKNFISQGRLDVILRQIRPGDYLLVQFGHNDATQGVDDRYASPEDYKEYLRVYVEGTRQRGATPILVTPVSRRSFNSETGEFNVSFPEYVAKMTELAQEEDVALVDLSALSRAYLNEIGPEEAKSVFLHVPAGIYQAYPDGRTDDTHFQEYGAIQMARLVANAVGGLELPLSAHVRAAEPPADVPPRPTGVVAGSVTNASTKLVWDETPTTDIYRVYVKGADEGEDAWRLASTSTIPQATVGGLAEGVGYDLRVVAANGRGASQPSEPVRVVTRSAAYRYDFGPVNGPVTDGYTEVTRQTLYSEERGYGFIDPGSMIDRDRGSPEGVGRDFVAWFSGRYEFVVDVPNGTYAARVYVGDILGTVRTNFEIEGRDYGRVAVSRGVTAPVFDGITVTDGQLNVVVTGQTGHFNGLDITPILLAPSGLEATDVTIDGADASVSLGWNAVDGVTGYRVYRTELGTTDPELVGEATATSFVDDTPDVGQEYSYQVTAVDPTGLESVRSAAVPVAVIDPSVPVAAVPAGLELLDIQKRSVNLGWAAQEGALFYAVYRAESGDGEYAYLGRVTEPRFTDSDVLTTIPYHYRVASVNAGGYSERSAPLETPAVTTLYRAAEWLDRAPVAVRTDGGVYVGWRLLGSDPETIGFHVYRDGERITSEPLTGSTNYLDPDGTADSAYHVTAILTEGGEEQRVTEEFGGWARNYLDVPLTAPSDAYTKDGQPYSYRANDVSVGDLDGDGQYELVVKWDPTNSHDNSHSGYTGNVYLDAYELDGTRLWRIDLGHNIRAGAHYTQFMVYDLDSDGRAEVTMKTADGTVDGEGNVIGDASRDHRNSGGYVLLGDEFLTVFDGVTGRAVDTVDYVPPRGDVGSWGDTYGNRVDRFLAGVAYLDGEHPSVVFSRGYYTRTVIAAWDFDGEQLTQRWVFDSNDWGREYQGQGNHSLGVADLDGDQKDEILFGAMAIDDDGSPLYNTGLLHGDAHHLTDLDPSRPGLEVFGVHEAPGGNGGIIAAFRDAGTGEVIWSVPGDRDTGRGAAADIDPRHPGAEAWSISNGGAWNDRAGQLRTATGELLSDRIPAANFVTWWDGDLLREITDHEFDEATRSGVPVVSKWDPEAAREEAIFRAEGTLSNNDTKGNPSLQADLFGDWREELIFRTEDSSALRIYATTDVTEHRIRTLMHDPVYRLAIAWQNVGYNQPPHPSFYLGEGMATPPAPRLSYTGAAAIDLEVEAVSVCTGRRVMVTVRATHAADGPADLEFSTRYGTRTRDDFPSGRETAQPFPTRQAAIVAGEATVVATAVVDGTEVRTEIRAPYQALGCAS